MMSCNSMPKVRVTDPSRLRFFSDTTGMVQPLSTHAVTHGPRHAEAETGVGETLHERLERQEELERRNHARITVVEDAEHHWHRRKTGRPTIALEAVRAMAVRNGGCNRGTRRCRR